MLILIAKWVNIGTAKDLWTGKAKNVEMKEKAIIIAHMKKAEGQEPLDA